MATKTQEREALQQALREVQDQYAQFERAVGGLNDAESPDALDEAEATLAVEAHWLQLKAEAVSDLLADS